MSAVDFAALILRIALAAVFIVQGYRKLLAAPGAKGSGAALEALIAAVRLPVPHALAVAVAMAELGGGALILVGLLTRLATLPLAVTMIVAIVVFKWREGFQGGWDWPFTVLAACVALALLGPGHMSLDSLLPPSPLTR